MEMYHVGQHHRTERSGEGTHGTKKAGAHADQSQIAMDGRPRVCHPKCGERRTTIINGEEITGDMTVDQVDMAKPLL